MKGDGAVLTHTVVDIKEEHRPVVCHCINSLFLESRVKEGIQKDGGMEDRD